MARVMVVYGTRPEAIKLAPVLRELAADPDVHVDVVVTGQHRDLLAPVHGIFGITPDVDLGLGRAGQSVATLAAQVVAGVAGAIDERRPDLVLVHGDTTTTMAGALAAFCAQVPVAHLEAGLRSGDLDSPFPEEGNRRLVTAIAGLHLAPTAAAFGNLLLENVDASSVVVTGNTVIDALLAATDRPAEPQDPAVREAVASGARIVLLTGHRRESWGGGLARVARAVRRVVEERPDTVVVAPLHPNPLVRQAIAPELAGLDRAYLVEPLDYPEFCALMNAAYCIVTDSGGIQEEAPSLGVPVLVTRDTTERQEAVLSGAALLVGTDEEALVAALSGVLDDTRLHERMARAGNPYGDGRAARRCVAAIKQYLGVGARLPEFMAVDGGGAGSGSPEWEWGTGAKF